MDGYPLLMKNPFENLKGQESSPEQPEELREMQTERKPYSAEQAPLDNKELESYAARIKADPVTKGKEFELAENPGNPAEYMLRTPLPDGTDTITYISKSLPLDEIKNIMGLKIFSPLAEEDYAGMEKLGEREE